MNTTQLEVARLHSSPAPPVRERTDGTLEGTDQRLAECNQALRKLARYIKDPVAFAKLREYYFKPVRTNIGRQNTKAALRRLAELEEYVGTLGMVIRRSRIRPSRRLKSTALSAAL